ncbi:LysE family translocator [Coralliovum pocilloporae]|uniref:LysE family translocator n=1 Tax=Coralliovum pocilloporae TaxID=3066369 RepID=UPI0033071F61
MSLDFTLFLFTSFLLVIAPGPSVVYVVAHSLRLGRAAGVASALGTNFGSYGLIAVAAFGFSGLIEQFPGFLTVVQFCGGLYIGWIAYKMWPRRRLPDAEAVDIELKSNSRIFVNGVITTLLNPKDILFYAAYIPTFLNSEDIGSSYRTQFILLALIYACMGLVTKCTFAVFCSQAAAFTRAEGTILLNYFSALVLFVLGAFLVLEALFF